MAIFDGSYFHCGFQIMIWMDPNRYRATIWSMSDNGIFSVKERRMVGIDRQKLKQRAFEWCEKKREVNRREAESDGWRIEK